MSINQRIDRSIAICNDKESYLANLSKMDVKDLRNDHMCLSAHVTSNVEQSRNTAAYLKSLVIKQIASLR